MLRTTTDIGNKVYQNMIERSKAILWAQSLATNMKEEAHSTRKTDITSGPSAQVGLTGRLVTNESSDGVSSQDRPLIKMKLASKMKPKICKTSFLCDE